MGRSLPWVWGATPAEVARRYPADDVVTDVVGDLAEGRRVRAMTRAADVAAPPAVLWRWLCQIAVAPYSYDWLDNRGRRSPRTLTPGAERLEVGQTMATVFRLTSFDDGHHWTAITGERGRRLFGVTAMTYAAEPAPTDAPASADTARLVCRIATAVPGPLALGLAWGDLVMMRRQFAVLAGLAEQTAS